MKLAPFDLGGCALAAAVLLVSTGSAQTLLRSVNGPAAGAQFGKACIVVPDQNGDGYRDLLVGAPNFNGGRGAIYCLSGAHLGSGLGASILWSLAPPVAANDNFGAALADVGDITGDGVHDFLVGQPGYDHVTNIDAGAVRLVHGSAHSIVSLIHGAAGNRLGTSIAACGSLNGNASIDVALGSPDALTGAGIVRIVDGSRLTQTMGVTSTGFAMAALSGVSSLDHFGASIASGVDLTGDGVAELVIGAPGRDNGGASDAGSVYIYDAVTQLLFRFDSLVAGERLGESVDIEYDYDGDGIADVVAGAPNSANGSSFEVGRVVVFSSARVLAQTPPYEITAFAFGSVTPPVNHSDPDPNFHFGAAVRACADLNHDGVGEIMIGAPDYFTAVFTGGFNFRGLARIYSGATGSLLTTLTGASTDRLGDALTGAIDDLDGDGFEEFVLAGSLSDAGGTDSGVIKCYRLFPLAPSTYCAGKLNSLGCVPAISFSGSASETSGLPFLVTCANLVNQKNGLFFYSHGPLAVLFQGGTKCVADPAVRTPSQNSGGATSGSSCTGAFNFDFNDWLVNGPDVSLVAGSEIYVQCWSRDPASPSHTSLSNALRFVVNP